jgi:hypothetical protein
MIFFATLCGLCGFAVNPVVFDASALDSCLAVPPWRSKNRSMNGIRGEASFRAGFAPVEPHAAVTGQMPHADY